MTNFESLVTSQLAALIAEHRCREIPCDNVDQQIVDLCSNDYLGLGAHADECRDEFAALFSDAAFTSSASRLLSRRQKYHKLLEKRLGELYGRDALLFNSGYHANMGCIGALNLPGTLFVVDKLIHASVLDALHACGARYVRFRHNDIEHLQRILAAKGDTATSVVLVVESVYSMDGDVAPLRELVALRRSDPRIVLYVDEAHAVGCFGEQGLGVCEQEGLTSEADIIIGTLGKALASSGAYAVTSSTVNRWLVNAARSFIFSTALPPVCCAWSLFMLDKSVSMSAEREHLSSLSHWFARAVGIEWPGSQIIPYITGDAERAIETASCARSLGFDVLPIRRPTVPPGGERLRVSLNADLTAEQLQPLADWLRDTRQHIKS